MPTRLLRTFLIQIKVSEAMIPSGFVFLFADYLFEKIKKSGIPKNYQVLQVG